MVLVVVLSTMKGEKGKANLGKSKNRGKGKDTAY